MAIFGLIRRSSVLSYLFPPRHLLSGEQYEMGRRDSISPTSSILKSFHASSRRLRSFLVAGILLSSLAVAAFTMKKYLLLSLLTGAWATPFSTPFGSVSSFTTSSHHKLRFTSPGTFQLCVFSDLHYGESKCICSVHADTLNACRFSSLTAEDTPICWLVQQSIHVTVMHHHFSPALSLSDRIPVLLPFSAKLSLAARSFHLHFARHCRCHFLLSHLHKSPVPYFVDALGLTCSADEDSDWAPVQDINSTRVMNSILDDESPQLVVINGDLITGENTYKHNSSDYVDKIVAPLVERDLLWASTYGNHDSDFNLSREAILAKEQQYPNALTHSMVRGRLAGVSNYYLPVYASRPTSYTGSKVEIPALILWFFDSRGGNYYQELEDGEPVPQPNWVDQSVVDWFEKTKAALIKHYGKIIPSLAFYHIPINAMLAEQRLGIDAQREPGINDDNPLAQQGQASGQGEVSGSTFNYTSQDGPFMKSLIKTEGLMATFSGHGTYLLWHLPSHIS